MYGKLCCIVAVRTSAGEREAPQCMANPGARVGALQVPATRAGYALSTAEHFVGLLLSALLLGAVVTKASIPSAKLVFSKVRQRGSRPSEQASSS